MLIKQFNVYNMCPSFIKDAVDGQQLARKKANGRSRCTPSPREADTTLEPHLLYTHKLAQSPGVPQGLPSIYKAS